MGNNPAHTSPVQSWIASVYFFHRLQYCSSSRFACFPKN